MAKYITLYQFTDQGIKNFQGTVQRAKDATAAVEKMGGKLLSIHWTIGPYDLVSVNEFPDDETQTVFALKLGAAGNVRTTTMRAFDA
ncbi:MAG: GYD domain-containing protein, partial [Thermodesulfobacteriota bacterium]